MGRKHTRERKFIFLYLACWLSFSLVGTGCSPSHKPYVEGPDSFWQFNEAGRLLAQAKSSFERGDFLTAIKENQQLLNDFPQTYGDHALFAMGLIYAYPEYFYSNYEISLHFFDRLVREYPESIFKNPSDVWISHLKQTMEHTKEIEQKNEQIASLKNELISEKKQTKNLLIQIKRLKEIDLDLEEKKRETTPNVGNHKNEKPE